jgi:hypothetical protein
VPGDQGRATAILMRQAGEHFSASEAIAVNPFARDTGIYDTGFNRPFGPLFTITRDRDQLFAQMSRQPKLPIYPEGGHAYFYKGIPAQLTFVVDGKGATTQLILHHNGRDIEAQRIGDWPIVDQPPAVDPKIFPHVVGWYQLNPFMVVAVLGESNHLFVQRPGQERFEVFSSSAGVYFSGDGRVWVTFRPEGIDRASEIILYDEAQMGAMRSRRIDDAKGREIQDAVAREDAAAPDGFITQQPASGGGVMVRKYIDMLRSGAADDDLVSPRAANLLPQRSFLRDELTKLGPLRSISFRGVALTGVDMYDAKFANGRAKIMIRLGPNGKLD